jgi:hypothetical protein
VHWLGSDERRPSGENAAAELMASIVAERLRPGSMLFRQA